MIGPTESWRRARRRSLHGDFFSVFPAMTLVAEVCPLAAICVFGSAAAQGGNQQSAGAGISGFGPRVTSRSTTSFSADLDLGLRWIFALNFPLQPSAWVTAGVHGSNETTEEGLEDDDGNQNTTTCFAPVSG